EAAVQGSGSRGRALEREGFGDLSPRVAMPAGGEFYFVSGAGPRQGIRQRHSSEEACLHFDYRHPLFASPVGTIAPDTACRERTGPADVSTGSGRKSALPSQVHQRKGAAFPR